MILTTELFLILTQNLLFTHLIGLPPLVRAAESRRRMLLSAGFSAIFILAACTALSAVRGLLPAGLTLFLLPLCSAVFCGLLDLLLVLAAGAMLGERAKPLILEIHAAAFSGAVLGAVLLCFANAGAVGTAFAFGLRCGVGYLAAYAMLAAAAPILTSDKMPASVRGWRGMYLYAGLISLAAACINL